MIETPRWKRSAVTLTLLALLLLGSARPVHAEGPPAALETSSPGIAVKALDVVIVRPATLAQALLGGFALTVAYPLSLLSGDSEHVLEVALGGPLDYALKRPLGEF